AIVGLAHLDAAAKITPTPGIVRTAQFIAQYPISAAGLVIAIAVAYSAFERRLVRPERTTFFKVWQSLGQPFGRVAVGTSMIMVGVLSLWLAAAILEHYPVLFDVL